MAFQTPQKQLSFSRELRQVLQERNLLSAKSRDKVCSMLNTSTTPNGTSMNVPGAQLNSDKGRLKNFHQQAVLEILTSEKAYLEQLEMLMKYFVMPLKENAIIDDSSHTLLFGQIEMIHNLNGEFLRELETDTEHVAEAFLKMAPFFKLYSVYAFDYRNALILLQDLTCKNPVFRKFLEQTESRPEIQRKLISLMIVPIQRVPRYKLLLQQVLYYTSPADPSYKLLRESIKQIESTVSHINSCVEDQESTQMLVNLQNSLCNRTPNIVKPSRKVIKEGILQKVTRNGTEIRRYCILMSDIFMYCKILKDRAANTHIENALECCCIFPLNKCKVYELLPGNFKLTCQGDGIIFSTMDLQLQRAWVAFIRDAIDMHLQCRKTLRKESSKRTPLRRKALKNFGSDYVLSPNKKRGEYETIFRNENRSSESEDSDSGGTKKSKCFGKLRAQCETKWLDRRRRNLKRRASSPSAKESQTPKLRKGGCNRLVKLCNDKTQRQAPMGILKQKTTTATTTATTYGANTNSDYDTNFGFASHFPDTKTYFRAHSVDNTIPTALKREDIFTLKEFHNKKLSHTDSNDNAFLTPPLKKRVKFDDSINASIKDCADDLNIPQALNCPDKGILTNDMPLHHKIWNFFANLF